MRGFIFRKHIIASIAAIDYEYATLMAACGCYHYYELLLRCRITSIKRLYVDDLLVYHYFYATA